MRCTRKRTRTHCVRPSLAVHASHGIPVPRFWYCDTRRRLHHLLCCTGTDITTEMPIDDASAVPSTPYSQVSEGFRPPRAACLTDEQWQLVCCCWDADPCARPPMAVVTGQLAAMLSDVRKERERSSKAQQVRRGGLGAGRS